jgi:hypothetical protein
VPLSVRASVERFVPPWSGSVLVGRAGAELGAGNAGGQVCRGCPAWSAGSTRRRVSALGQPPALRHEGCGRRLGPRLL